MFFLLRLRRRKRVSTQTGVGNLLDNTKQDGDDDGGLEGLPEHDEENGNGKHVRHGCFWDVARENDDVRGGWDKEGRAKAGTGENSTKIPLYNVLTGLGPYQIIFFIR